MVKRTWPTGIRPSGKGIRIRIFQNERLYYSETLAGDPYKKADLAAAIRRRKWLESRKLLGLPLFEQDVNTENEIFADLAQSYLNSLEVKKSTADDYLRILSHYWLPKFGRRIAKEVSTRMVKEALSGFKVSGKTKKNLLVPLRGAFDHGEVTPNPVNATLTKKAIRKHQKKKISRYTLKERHDLLHQLSGEQQVYFAILFGCGLRPGECLGLLWSDYDGTSLSISKQITRRRLEPTTKTCHERSVFVPTWVRTILNSHVTRFKNGHIFLNSIGTPHLDTDRFNEPWRELHTKLGIPYRTPYTCRHTRAAELLSTKVEPGDAAKQLGHSLEMFFRTYAEWIEEFGDKKDESRFEGSTDKILTNLKV